MLRIEDDLNEHAWYLELVARTIRDLEDFLALAALADQS
jgi:hypothetical protein